MAKDDTPISVAELIRQYNQELLDFQKKHVTTVAVQPTAATAEDIPMPDIARDLQQLREQEEVAESLTDNIPMTDISAGNDADETQTVNDENAEYVSPAQPNINQTPFPITDEEENEASPDQPMDMSLGYIKVSTKTGRGTLPVQGARVTVTQADGDKEILLQTKITDESGDTAVFALPAVSGIYSMKPGNGSPFTYYSIYIYADGFYPVQLRNVPMYGGTMSVQPVELIPTAEGSGPLTQEIIVEGAPQDLQ